MSGRDGAMQIDSPKQIQAAIDRLKQDLLDGKIVDVKAGENTLKTLESLQREYEQQTQAAARAEEELARKRKESADAALQAKTAETKQYIEGKASIGKQITDAQKDYDTVTAKLERMQQARQVIQDEEAHGIFRKKWGNLNVSDVSTKEAELLNE